MSKVRVRFAPSPTGPLHIGGVRTALYNYLFAKKHQGDFILRVEDTDQQRLVKGAEDYIVSSLNWLGLFPDESPEKGGEYGPYRQSERKSIYEEYAWKLVESGHAYLAFDSAEEIEAMKAKMEEAGVIQPQYNSVMRNRMKNSITLSAEEVEELKQQGIPYVIRIKVPVKEDIRFTDIIRGSVLVHSSTLDDKVLLKSGGMPTYHLANIVDDHLMKITHVIRGEEWLPSAPLHVLLYKFFGWEDTMPQFAHLPLILKPNGKGKLSKRDGQKQDIPVFPLEYHESDNIIYKGFKEEGYLPEAVINFLSMLGWNPGTEQEMFSLENLIKEFSLERITKGGARFDLDKAKWFNQQYIKDHDISTLSHILQEYASERGYNLSDTNGLKLVSMMKERVVFIKEMIDNADYLFVKPEDYDQKVLRKKWKEDLFSPFENFAAFLEKEENIEPSDIKNSLEKILDEYDMPLGKVMQALRLSITGQGGGPDLMEIINFIGGSETASRIRYAIENLPVKP